MTAMIDDSRSRAHGKGTWPNAPGLPPVLDGPGAHRVLVAAALLLEAIARQPLGDPDATGRTGRPRAAGAALTHSETRVLHYLPTNLSAREIASELYLSVNTIKTHQRHLYAKLGACSRSQAVERARALGLLAPSWKLPVRETRVLAWPGSQTGVPARDHYRRDALPRTRR